MGSLLCKIFRFVLNIFEQVINVVATAVKTIGTAAVDVLSDLAYAVGDAASGLFGGNGFLSLLLIGGALWFFMGSRDEKTKNNDDLIRSPTQPPLRNN